MCLCQDDLFIDLWRRGLLSILGEEGVASGGLEWVTARWKEVSTGKSGATMTVGLPRVSMSPMEAFAREEDGSAMEGL